MLLLFAELIFDRIYLAHWREFLGDSIIERTPVLLWWEIWCSVMGHTHLGPRPTIDMGYAYRWSGTDVGLAHLGAPNLPIIVGLASLLLSNRQETPIREPWKMSAANNKKHHMVIILWWAPVYTKKVTGDITIWGFASRSPYIKITIAFGPASFYPNFRFL